MKVMIWVLWALKIAGLITITYQHLTILTIMIAVVSIIFNMLLNVLKGKTAMRELDRMGDVEDDLVVPTLLMMIYKKINK